MPDQTNADTALSLLKALVLLAFPVWGALLFAFPVHFLPVGKTSFAIIALFALFAPLFGGLPIFKSNLAAQQAGLVFIAYYCLSLFAIIIVWVQVLQ